MYYSKKEYKFIRFERSRTKHKKYDGILQNKKTKRYVRVPFGSSSHEQYHDSSGLKLYSHLDHGDSKRRINYKKRHSVFIKPGYYSPGDFALRFLWT